MIPLPEEQAETKFAPLLLRTSLNLRPIQKQFPTLPHDFYCPSVQSELENRVCKYCGFYTSSKKGAMKHRKAMHPKGEPLQTSRIQPRRVIARRQKEVLCLLDAPFGEEVEWVVVENLEDSFQNEENSDQITSSQETQIPIISSIKDWLCTPWTEDI